MTELFQSLSLLGCKVEEEEINTYKIEGCLPAISIHEKRTSTSTQQSSRDWEEQIKKKRCLDFFDRKNESGILHSQGILYYEKTQKSQTG